MLGNTVENIDALRFATLRRLLKARMGTFLREYDKLAKQCAAEGVDHPRYLLRLVELELIERQRRMIERRIKEARFPTVKSLDSFDFTAVPSLNKALVLELARCEYIERRENVIAGIFRGEPSAWKTFCPPSVAGSNQVNGTKFLYRNSRTVFVSRHFPGPTTRSPSVPMSDSSSRRRVKAIIIFSPRLGTRFSSARN